MNRALAEVPDKFRQYLLIIINDVAVKFPDQKPWDHKIKLIAGKIPPKGPFFPLNGEKLEILRQWINSMLSAGRIRKSSSPCSSPVMFVEKKDENDPLRLVINYRGLNNITIPVRYPIPLISELQDRLAGAKYFTKINLKLGFYFVRMAEGEEWKTAFRCRYGLFEFRVIPMGLINAPVTFQAIINHILHDLLNNGVLVYINDILIYTKTIKEYNRLVLDILKYLWQNNLAITL